MDDRKIVELYWARQERAISETEKKYGKYCRSIKTQLYRTRNKLKLFLEKEGVAL